MEKKPKPASLSKKHLARLERERRQARLIRWIAFGVILTTVLLITYGILETSGTLLKINSALQKNRPVAVVNGEEISVGKFQTYVRLQRQRLINQYSEMQYYSQIFGFDVSAQLGQIESMLSEDQKEQLGQDVLDAMIDEVLIRQEAQKRGILVDSDKVEQAIRANYGYYPDGTPTPEPTATPLVFSTLSPQQLKLVTLTPTATTIPTSTPDPQATATPIPSPTLTPLPQPTPTPYTLDGFQKTYQETLDRLKKDISLSEADFRAIFEAQLYRQELLKDVTKDVPRTREMVWARHILVKDEAIARAIRQRLLAGKDFGTLAAEVSEDPGSRNKGGDLGWFAKGQMVAAFEDAAFSLKVGEISQPVQSDFGYHIIQVLGHENRPMTASEYQDAVNKMFNEWLANLRAESEITIYDRWKNFIPTQPVLQVAQ